MSVARVNEITSAPPKSFEDAVECGLARAARTFENSRGAWFQERTILVERNKIGEVFFILKD